MSRFDGKVALVTGAASGIGKQIVLRFAADGGTPVIADLNLDAADATAREIRAKGSDAFAVAMNVADEAMVEKGVADIIEEYGQIDVLASNAGIQIVKPVVDFPFSDWKRLLAIHLDGEFTTTDDVADAVLFLCRRQNQRAHRPVAHREPRLGHGIDRWRRRRFGALRHDDEHGLREPGRTRVASRTRGRNARDS